MRYEHLIFGTFNRKEVDDAVRWEEWQTLRVSLLGTSTEYKLRRCEQWLEETTDRVRAEICVTNYIYALKRGGLLKGETRAQMRYKWVYYQMRFIVFKGGALLDPSTEQICYTTSERNAKLVVEALNEKEEKND